MGNPAAPSSVRGLPDNPAQGRRPVPNSAATSNGHPPPPPPIPNLRNAPSNATLSASSPITSPAQVIALAREAMQTALESEGQAAEVGAAGTGLRAGVTVDLSRKGIQRLPEEVVDIVKDQLERYAPHFQSPWRMQDHHQTNSSRFFLSVIVDSPCRTTNFQAYQLDFPNVHLYAI